MIIDKMILEDNNKEITIFYRSRNNSFYNCVLLSELEAFLKRLVTIKDFATKKLG